MNQLMLEIATEAIDNKIDIIIRRLSDIELLFDNLTVKSNSNISIETWFNDRNNIVGTNHNRININRDNDKLTTSFINFLIEEKEILTKELKEYKAAKASLQSGVNTWGLR